ncbi:MAG: 1-deoxy-D-xylulose-5-phosphate synthase, partial [Myxococcaceae bacterium]|nr:1-deoxy-D-xylulose-5-phosphate synthase [Myxococcaceae bacterium]
GAVELIVALHRTFKSPVDRIVFDVGHQAYAHKLLTGRGPRMGTLRQAGGIAPFLDPAESEHDAFGAGHACTAVSVALGILAAKRHAHQPGQVVAVVGDGALTGGLTFEGLNNAGYGELPLKVVLNDNGMSISHNVGAVPRLLGAHSRQFFEALGFTWLGTVDGHEMPGLLEATRRLAKSPRPAVLHVRTQKGRGFAPAEDDGRTRGHAMGPYELRDGKLVRSRAGQPTFSDAFVSTLERAMERDPRVVAVTPAMLEGSSLVALKARFPDRVFDVGIAEQHAVAFCAGLAHAGLRPVCVIYSTFLQRAYDQVVHDVALPSLPVVFAIDRAGVVGADGATHQGAYDVGFLRALPSMTVAAPVWGEDLDGLLGAALAANGPFAIRFPRGTLPPADPRGGGSPAGARWLRRAPSPKLTLVTLGPLALPALEAARAHPDWSVLDARYAAPLDEAAVLEAAATGALVTVEEGTVRGGLGGAVLELLAARRISARVATVGMPGDRFLPHGEARTQRAQLGLDAAGLERTALGLLR